MGRILTLNRGLKEPEMPRYSFTTTGIIQYDPPRPGMKRRTDWWVIAKMDREITAYYRWYVKTKYFIDLCEPSWNAHVSIVRGERPTAAHQEMWKRLDGKKIEIQYGHVVKQVEAKPHFWYIDAYAPEIDEIRKDLGLQTGFAYHMTIGRVNHENNYVRPDQVRHKRRNEPKLADFFY